MAKMKFGLDDIDVDEVEVTTSAGGYDGPTPPKGLYKCRTKQMKIMLNKKSGPMLYVVSEIWEKEGTPKAQYNGYTFYDYQNITAQSAPYVLGQLVALGFSEQDARKFLKEGPNLNGKAPTQPGRDNAVDIRSIGSKKLLDDAGKHIPRAFAANTGLSRQSQADRDAGYDQRLEIKGYVRAKGNDTAEEDVAEEASGPSASAPPPALDDDDTAADDVTDEDGDEEDDDVEDGDAPF